MLHIRKTLAVALTLAATLAPSVALAADSLGTSGPITSFQYIGDSSSYSGNFRLVVQIDGTAYHNGASGFCAAYAELDSDEISQLQQLYIHGIDVTPRYKAGTYGTKCLVGWIAG